MREELDETSCLTASFHDEGKAVSPGGASLPTWREFFNRKVGEGSSEPEVLKRKFKTFCLMKIKSFFSRLNSHISS